MLMFRQCFKALISSTKQTVNTLIIIPNTFATPPKIPMDNANKLRTLLKFSFLQCFLYSWEVGHKCTDVIFFNVITVGEVLRSEG